MPTVLENPALAMYVAAAVALVVLVGFFWYLWSLDRNVAELRRALSEKPAPPQATSPTLVPQRRLAQEQGDGNNAR